MVAPLWHCALLLFQPFLLASSVTMVTGEMQVNDMQREWGGQRRGIPKGNKNAAMR